MADHDEDQRHDRSQSASRDAEYEALLQELRVLLPGVEILFAFLLTIAFTEKFGAINGHLKWVYLVALGCSAFASVLLVTPSVYHRLRWREAHKEDVLRRSNAIALSATGFLAVAATSGLYVASAVVFDDTVAAALAGVIGGATVLLWYGLPMYDRARGGSRSRNEDAGSREERKPANTASPPHKKAS
ncbi:MAG TPA: DUF6328 family protein [Actinomycetota bacterium]|nr:DUF6328 family protein [Actinomycetota bacterium]